MVNMQFMSDDKVVSEISIRRMARLGEYKELAYVIKRNKYPIDKIEQILGENGDYIMVRCVVENKPEKNFKVLERALSSRDIKGELLDERVELLPYASKEFTEETAKFIMQSDSICNKYNYLIKTKDKRFIKPIEDEVIQKDEVTMMVGLAAFVPGVDVQRLEDYYIENCHGEDLVNFMLFVPKCNKTKLNKIIDSEYLVNYRLKVYKSSNNDYSRIYDSLVKLGKPEYAEAFFSTHEDRKIEELKKYATTEKQKEFVASLIGKAAERTC